MAAVASASSERCGEGRVGVREAPQGGCRGDWGHLWGAGWLWKGRGDRTVVGGTWGQRLRRGLRLPFGMAA